MVLNHSTNTNQTIMVTNRSLYIDTHLMLGVLLNDNLNDNDDIMKQMRGLYARANSVLRKFAACSFEVKLRLFQAFCLCPYVV